jgi:2-dehydropantoate 2-reductase
LTGGVILRIAIIGAGAMGGLYGALLARQGYDVHFLMRRDYEAVCKKGLHVKSCWGDFHLERVNCYLSVADMPVVDLVFVGLKTTANDHYAELIEPLMGPDSWVLTAQNGLGNDEKLAELFGPQRVSGGVAFLCCNRLEPGVINHVDYGHVHIGNFQRPPDDRLKTFAEMMRKSRVECKVVDDLALARWKKLIWNVPFNGLSALLDKTSDILVTDPELRQRSELLMHEVQAGARALGIIIEEDFIRMMLDYTEKMVPYHSSMHLDCKAKRPMEIESIIGQPLRQGLAKGVQMPQLQLLYDQLSRKQ